MRTIIAIVLVLAAQVLAVDYTAESSDTAEMSECTQPPACGVRYFGRSHGLLLLFPNEVPSRRWGLGALVGTYAHLSSETGLFYVDGNWGTLYETSATEWDGLQWGCNTQMLHVASYLYKGAQQVTQTESGGLWNNTAGAQARSRRGSYVYVAQGAHVFEDGTLGTVSAGTYYHAAVGWNNRPAQPLHAVHGTNQYSTTDGAYTECKPNCLRVFGSYAGDNRGIKGTLDDWMWFRYPLADAEQGFDLYTVKHWAQHVAGMERVTDW